MLVGKRAWNVALDKAETQLYVVNGLSDDVTVVDVASAKALKTVPVGRVPYTRGAGRVKHSCWRGAVALAACVDARARGRNFKVTLLAPGRRPAARAHAHRTRVRSATRPARRWMRSGWRWTKAVSSSTPREPPCS